MTFSRCTRCDFTTSSSKIHLHDCRTTETTEEVTNG